MPRPVIAITDNTFAPISPERAIFAELDAEIRFAEDPALTEDAVLALAQGADAILCDGAPITRRVIESLPTVKVVSEYGIGYDNVDAAAAAELGVWVANVPGFCTDEVADHALAMLLALARRLPALDKAVRQGKWGAGSAGPMRRLSSQTLGLIGFGRIGRTLSRKASAVGLRVLAHSPNTTPERAREHGAQAATFDQLLAESDYVALVAPATPETRGLIGAAALAKMKPTAYLINAGRGALVDEPALIDALKSGRIAGAALDVYAQEPLPPGSPLRELDNVLLTPHAAFYSEESLRELQESAARNALAVLKGGRPLTPVNEPARLRR